MTDPFHHSFLEIQGSAIHDKSSVTIGVEGPPLLALGINPRLDSHQNEQAVFIHQTGVLSLAIISSPPQTEHSQATKR